MTTIEHVDAATFLSALTGKRPKRAKPGGASLTRPTLTKRGQIGDWTQGKADKALTMGWQLGFDARQLVFAFRPGERTMAYERIDDLLTALEAMEEL